MSNKKQLQRTTIMIKWEYEHVPKYELFKQLKQSITRDTYIPKCFQRLLINVVEAADAAAPPAPAPAPTPTPPHIKWERKNWEKIDFSVIQQLQ